MTITESIAKNGTAATARKMVDTRISAMMGIGLDDLSDTVFINDFIDDVEAHLEDDNVKGAIALVKETITLEFLEENEFG